MKPAGVQRILSPSIVVRRGGKLPSSSNLRRRLARPGRKLVLLDADIKPQQPRNDA